MRIPPENFFQKVLKKVLTTGRKPVIMITVREREETEMTYKVRELAGGRFGVYECSEWREVLVKTFKTEKGANNWVGKHS